MSDSTTLSSLKLSLAIASFFAVILGMNPYGLLNSPTATINLFIGILIGVISIIGSYVSLLTNKSYKYYEDFYEVSLYFDFCFIVFMLSAVTPLIQIFVAGADKVGSSTISIGIIFIPLFIITVFTVIPIVLSFFGVHHREDMDTVQVLWAKFKLRTVTYMSVIIVSVVTLLLAQYI